MLDGTVEVDETYVGGKFQKGTPHRKKDVIIGIRQRGGHLYLIHAADSKLRPTAESAFSLLKRGIMGTWHNISAKHLQACLDEMVFRSNRRKNSDLFLDTLRHMVTAPVLTFERLTAEKNESAA